MMLIAPPTGTIIADNVSYDDFLRDRNYDGRHVEWVAGKVIEMSPVSRSHSAIARFLTSFLDAYLGRTGGGDIFADPMLMRCAPNLPARAPDVQVILPANADIIAENVVNGPADLVVEIVSPDSYRRDFVEKFSEYERGGVPEYWIIDPLKRAAFFYQRDERGVYAQMPPNERGIYRSGALKRLRFEVALLWRDKLPHVTELLPLIDAMLSDHDQAKGEDTP